MSTTNIVPSGISIFCGLELVSFYKLIQKWRQKHSRQRGDSAPPGCVPLDSLIKQTTIMLFKTWGRFFPGTVSPSLTGAPMMGDSKSIIAVQNRPFIVPQKTPTSSSTQIVNSSCFGKLLVITKEASVTKTSRHFSRHKGWCLHTGAWARCSLTQQY